MSNERHEYEIHDADDQFGNGPHRGGPRRPHDRHRGRGGFRAQENPWESLFGADGPFGPRGPFGKGGFLGPEGVDVARAIWENATQGGSGRSWERADERGFRGPDEREHDGRGPGGRGRDERERDGRPGERERGERGHGGRRHHHGGHGEQEGADGERGRGPRGTRGGRGPWGPGGRGPGGRGPGGRGRRPKGDVRLAALLLIAEEPRNGYQLIEELAARTSGAWRPSSGAIYPALAQLEDEGLIAPVEVDGRKAYELTKAGREAVAGHGDNAAPWETATADASEAMGGRPGGELWHAFGQLAMATKAVGSTRDEAAMAEAATVLDQARRSLYRLLADGPQDSGMQDTDPQDTDSPE
ncbi:PadR family transcriptional regulator [Nostocoides veronense]|uniref:Transcription regulator PadR N-terminal domain-containing protein n=1 Tax=Nostocoides veronense TaxID=330836 RepID=A0ABN2M1L1_9MICO